MSNTLSTALLPRPSLSSANEAPRILDGIPPWSSSRNAKGKESKEPKSKHSRIPVALDKENLGPASPPGIKFKDVKEKGKETSSRDKKAAKRPSSAAPSSSLSSISRHARTQSQPKVQIPERK